MPDRDELEEEIEELKRVITNKDKPATREDLKFFLSTHAKVASRQMLDDLQQLTGYDLSDIKQREQFHSDLLFLRSLRAGTRTAGLKIFTTILGILATAAVVAVWEGFKRFTTIH